MIEVEQLQVKYGDVVAVDDLELVVTAGEVFGFIGPNGAGKTSTIKVLATLLRPTSGNVRVNGIDVIRHPEEVRYHIGYMPDFFGVYQDLTVSEYLSFFAAAFRIPLADRKRIISDVLALTELTGRTDDNVDTLSRGMKQRLGIARVLLHDPEVLLLDEPASGLDPRARIEIRELLKELRGLGKTIIISSHILHELNHLCTRIGIIDGGRMQAEGSLEEIYQQLDLKRIIHVRISNHSDQLVTAIHSLDGVVAVEPEVDRLAIKIREGELQPEELLNQMYRLGARMSMFQPEATDMETVFMKLTSNGSDQ
jgi:ABC-2 type transport system ATP-binding protein